MQLLKHDELVEPAISKLADALREQQGIIASQAERARSLSNQIAEFDDDHPEVSNSRQLMKYLDDALIDVRPGDPPRLRLDELLLRHLEEVARSLDEQDTNELQQLIEDAALVLAAKAPDCMAHPSPDRTVTIDGKCLQMWEVEQPRYGLMRTSRVWLISTDGIEVTVTQLH
jgi:hypothetical protein